MSLSLKGSPENNGLTSQPEGEEVAGHASNAGEASPRNARQRSHRTPVLVDSDDPSSDKDRKDELKIVRATTKFRFEPWLVLDGKHDWSSCKEKKAKIKKSKKSDYKKIDCIVCNLYDSLDEIQRSCARAINAIIREYWRQDSAVLDHYVKKNKENPKSKDWPFPNINGYQLAREVEPNLNTGIASALERKANAKWRQVRFDALIKQECSPPHYKSTIPIPIRNSDFKIIQHSHSSWDIRFSLHSGRHGSGTEFCVPIKAYDTVQRMVLQEISSGDWKQGELSIERDSRRRGKWFCKIAYTRFVKKQPPDKRYGAINKGIVCNLAAVSFDNYDYIDEGGDIEEHLNRFHARRRRLQNQINISNRKGHGRKRSLLPTNKLRDKVEAWRKTRLQTTAREVAKWFLKRGITTVFIEDFTGIRQNIPESLKGGMFTWIRLQTWPYYEQQTRLISCLQEAGITHHIVPSQNISRTCPECGHLHDHVPIKNDRMFKCEKCGYRRHIDIVAAKNVMTRGIERLNDDGKKNEEKPIKKATKKSKKGTSRKRKDK